MKSQITYRLLIWRWVWLGGMQRRVARTVLCVSIFPTWRAAACWMDKRMYERTDECGTALHINVPERGCRHKTDILSHNKNVAAQLLAHSSSPPLSLSLSPYFHPPHYSPFLCTTSAVQLIKMTLASSIIDVGRGHKSMQLHSSCATAAAASAFATVWLCCAPPTGSSPAFRKFQFQFNVMILFY